VLAFLLGWGLNHVTERVHVGSIPVIGRQTLRTKVVILFLAIGLLPLALMTGLNEESGRQTVQQEQHSILKTYSMSLAGQLDNRLSSYRTDSLTLSQDPRLGQLLSSGTTENDPAASDALAALTTYLDSDPTYLLAFVLDAKGLVRLSTNPDLYKRPDLSFREYYQVAITGKSYVSDISIGVNVPRPAALFFANPIRGRGGAPIGVVVLRADAEKGIWSLFDPSRIGSQRTTLLVDSDGVVVGMTPDSPLLEGSIFKSLRTLPPDVARRIEANKSFGPYQVTSIGLNPLMDRLRSSSSGNAEFHFHGRQEVAGFAHLQAKPWSVVVFSDLDAFLAPVHASSVRIGVIASGLALVLILAALILARTVSNPLQALAQSAQQLPASSGDEIGKLTSAFNHMIENLDRAQSELIHRADVQTKLARENARLYEKEQQRARSFEALHQLAVAAGGVLDPGDLGRRTADMAKQLLNVDGAALAVWDEGEHDLRVLAANPVGGWLRDGAGGSRSRQASRQAFETRDAVAIGAVPDQDPKLMDAPQEPYPAVLAVPLLVDDRAIGALAVSSRESRDFAIEEIRLLSLLGAQVAPALQAAKLFTELQASRERLSAVVSSAPIALVALDSSERFLLAEGQALSALGISGDEMTGRFLSDLTSELAPLAAELRAGLAGTTGEVTLRVGSVDLHVRYGPLRDPEAKSAGVIAVAIDITEQRRAEEARRESEAKSRFVATISHELRTPLNSILGFSQLLSAETFGVLNERQQHYVENVLTSGRHLLELINDLLDLSKVSAGQMDLHFEPLRSDTVLDEAVERIRPLADGKQIQIIVADQAETWVQADELRLRQVLLNLLSNAIKFTGRGGTVRLSARQEGSKVCLEVSDSGAGIPTEKLEVIFQEFTQLNSSRARTQEGTGLGLPLSRKLCELMGGEIRVSSRVGAGSTFTVVLSAASVPKQLRRAGAV
jgi:PAS domain S-box-containing protein